VALLRLAQAGARLAGHREVLADHVEAMAVLTALVAPTLSGGAAPTPEAPTPTGPGAADAPAAPVGDADRSVEPGETPTAGQPVVEFALEGDEASPVGRLTAPTPNATAFPEDDAEPEHEAYPLRRPWQHGEARQAVHGTAVGTQPARGFTDIAWVESLRTAALFQAFRRPLESDPTRLVVWGADLRQYRRAPQPEHLLVLVLDHTSRRRGWDWLPDLTPHVRDAYMRRSSVCVVEVGAAISRTPLRADLVVARSVLDPRVAFALEREPGRATPLAHGLELAFARMRHALQHGNAAVATATCVVATDALGNVPLDASLSDDLTGLVTDEGVEDALVAATRIRGLDAVTTWLVAAQGAPHDDLLERLGRALGCAVTEPVPEVAS
jgi:magnesium chelatase subunit D